MTEQISLVMLKLCVLIVLALVANYFAAMIVCGGTGAVTLEQHVVEYIEEESTLSGHIFSEIIEKEILNECHSGDNICEVNCQTIPGCNTQKVFQTLLTGEYKTTKENKTYTDVCLNRGSNDIPGLTYIDRGTPFSNQYRAMLSRHFPGAKINKKIENINSDWYYTQGLLIFNKKIIEDYGEVILMIADIKYIYQGVQSVCLKQKNWQFVFHFFNK
jgi:hypothetical protein